MKPFRRADRVAALILRVLSEVLQREIQDPRLERVTFTRVKLSSDLKFARIYFVSLFDADDKQKVSFITGFKDASGYFKRALSIQLDLRYMPELKFFWDEPREQASRIYGILKSLETDNGTDHR